MKTHRITSPPQKHGLRCFHCRQVFTPHIDRIYRSLNHFPYCHSCMRDNLHDDYDDATIDWIFQELDTPKYNGNFLRFYNDILFVSCPNCLNDTMILQSEIDFRQTQPISQVGGTVSCFECSTFMQFDKHGKVIKYASDEDAFYIDPQII